MKKNITSFLKRNYMRINSKVIFILRRFNLIKDDSFPLESYRFTREDAQKIYDIVLSGNLHHKTGEETIKLEKEFAFYNQSKYALATNSCASSLEMAIKAVGIQPGDEVIVPAYTFVATAQAVLNRGGIPVFADIDDTFTLSVESFEEKITKRTKAVIIVHLFGNVANIEKIVQIAKKHNLKIIEDCAQSLGGKYNNRPIGTFGDVGCFSFDIKKAIFTGQGGMLVTSNKHIYTTALHTRETGQLHDELGSDVITTGNTYAMTEMQSALARIMLRKLDNLNSKRKQSYDIFINSFDSEYLPIRWYRILPKVTPSFLRLIFMIDFNKLKIDRKEFLKKMNAMDIPMRTFYPVPLYSYTLFQKKKDILTTSTFPFSENQYVSYKNIRLQYTELFCKQQVGLDFSPYLTKKNIIRMNNSLRNILLEYQK